MTRVISIVSGKGGVGKTVTVANLGVLLASKFNKKVVVIDCNLTNPHLGIYLGSLNFWPVNLNDVIRNKATLDQAMYKHHSGVYVIPASFESRHLIRLNNYRLKHKLNKLFDEFQADIVLLDSPPGLTRDALMTFSLSSEIIFVATPHIPAIIDINKSCQQLKGKDGKPIGIVLNRMKNKKYELTEDEIFNFSNLPIIGRVPEDDYVLQSTNFKMPVASAFPKADSSKEFLRLAAYIAGEAPAPEPNRSGLSRFLGFFRK
ncbi:MAG: P-loop NTPase [Candidatus Aenigmatarchaeota archaeon]